MTVYRYVTLMRPPGLGACPMEGLIKCCYKEGYAPSGHHYWGWCDYNRRLSDKELSDYEMEYIGD